MHRRCLAGRWRTAAVCRTKILRDRSCVAREREREREKWCGQRERSGVARETEVVVARDTEVVWPEIQKWCGQRDRSGCGQRYRSGVAIETEVLFPEILVIQ